MATPRLAGSTPLTFSPPIQISPSVTSSSPAIMRNRVDFPHPEGPTNTTNSPSSMSRLTPWMTSVLPNRLTMFLRFKPAIGENSTYQREFPDARDENIRFFLKLPLLSRVWQMRFDVEVRLSLAMGPLDNLAGD